MIKARVADFLKRPDGADVTKPMEYFADGTADNWLDKLCLYAEEVNETAKIATGNIEVYTQVLRQGARDDDSEETRKIAREAIEYARKYSRRHEDLYRLMLTYLGMKK